MQLYARRPPAGYVSGTAAAMCVTGVGERQRDNYSNTEALGSFSNAEPFLPSGGPLSAVRHTQIGTPRTGVKQVRRVGNKV